MHIKNILQKSLQRNLQENARFEQYVDEVVKCGASIIKPAQKVFRGGYSGYFKDLDFTW